MKTGILLVEDYPAVRRGIRRILEMRGDWTVLAEAEDGEQGLTKAQEVRPDLAIVDIAMPRMNGLELTRELRRILPNIEVLVLTQHDSKEMVQAALSAGARSYVVKSSVAFDLIPAVEASRMHRTFISPSTSYQATADG